MKIINYEKPMGERERERDAADRSAEYLSHSSVTFE